MLKTLGKLGGPALLALLAALAGCKDNTDTTVNSAAASRQPPIARVMGRVLNGQTGLPVGATRLKATFPRHSRC